MKYIEREAVNALIEAECSPKVAAFLNHAIDDIPAADVREVVLCRDCKWWRGEGKICKGIGIDFDADGFCCEGERKDGADMRPVPSADLTPEYVYDDPMTDAMLSER